MLKVGDQYSLFSITADEIDKGTQIKITKMQSLRAGGWLMGVEMVGENPHAIADYFVTEDQRMRLGA